MTWKDDDLRAMIKIVVTVCVGIVVRHRRRRRAIQSGRQPEELALRMKKRNAKVVEALGITRRLRDREAYRLAERRVRREAILKARVMV